MNNADMPAMPQTGTEGASGDLNSSADWGGAGLTKREKACITLGIPETGDEELDVLILKSERKRVAAIAMQALIPVYWEGQELYDSADDLIECMMESSVEHADALLEELAK